MPEWQKPMALGFDSHTPWAIPNRFRMGFRFGSWLS